MKQEDYRRVVSGFVMDPECKDRIKKNVCRAVPQRNTFFRYGMVAACALVLIGCALTVQRLKMANSNTVGPQTAQNAISVSQAAGSGQTPASSSVLSSSRSSSELTAKSSPQNSAVDGTPHDTPFIAGIKGIDTPRFLFYNNSIYTIGGLIAPSKDRSAIPEKLIGFAWGKRRVCTVQNVDVSKNICMQCPDETILRYTNGSEAVLTGYVRYDFLLKNPITIQGKPYFLTDGLFTTTLDCTSPANNSIVYTIDLSDTLLPLFHQKILGKPICQVGKGTVYSIDEINPDNAVAIFDNKCWYFVVKKYGYTGKTIDDVTKEKGITIRSIF